MTGINILDPAGNRIRERRRGLERSDMATDQILEYSVL